MSEAKYKKVAQAIVKVGGLPIPISDTFLEIIKTLLGDDDEEIDMLLAFRRKSSQNLEQLKKNYGFTRRKNFRSHRSISEKGFYI